MDTFVKVVLAAIVFMIIAYVVHTVGAIATMNYYSMPEYLPVWSKIMMPTAGPPPMSFTIYSLAFSFIGGAFFAAVYRRVKGALGKMSVAKKGAFYGLLVFLIAGIQGALSMYLLFNLPIVLILDWTIESLIIYIVAGAAVAWIDQK